MHSIISLISLILALSLIYGGVQCAPNDPLIEAALDQVESTAISWEYDSLCNFRSAVQVLTTAQGSFALCSGDFGGSVKFYSLSGRTVTLAYFDDGEIQMYTTNKIFNGDRCFVVYGQVGKHCFAAAATITASSYMPTWKSSNVSASVVASYIENTFSPQVHPYGGVTGRCYPNSGTFKIVGLAANQAQNALSLRNSVYDGCEITEGNAREWARASWSIWPMMGAGLISVGMVFVAIFAPCLSCCLGA